MLLCIESAIEKAVRHKSEGNPLLFDKIKQSSDSPTIHVLQTIEKRLKAEILPTNNGEVRLLGKLLKEKEQEV